MENIYSDMKIVTVPRMRIARYVIISPNPECDVINYMNNWVKKSGLLDISDFKSRKIGWDFPFVSEQQTKQFGLRGYVYACSIPEDFQPKCDGAEITYLEEDTYGMLTITNPHLDSFVRIPEGFKLLINQINNSEYKTLSWENRYCFEEEYVKDNVEFMDIYIPVK